MQVAINCVTTLSKVCLDRLEMRPQAWGFQETGHTTCASILLTRLAELKLHATLSMAPSATVAQGLPSFIQCAKNICLCLFNVKNTVNSLQYNAVVVGWGGSILAIVLALCVCLQSCYSLLVLLMQWSQP